MRVKTGYLYHIKDEFFLKFKNYNLMQNHELGKTRPTYFTIKDGNVLWFIPLSTRVSKYQKLISEKLKKHGVCYTIMIREILGKDVAILLQNAFPTLEKYIDHMHFHHSMPARVSDEVTNEILINFKRMLKMKRYGVNLFFADIDNLKEELLNEIVVKN